MYLYIKSIRHGVNIKTILLLDSQIIYFSFFLTLKTVRGDSIKQTKLNII